MLLKPSSRRLLPFALGAALLPLAALATPLNLSDTGIIGRSLTSALTRTLNLRPAIAGLPVGPASEGTLTLSFAEGAPFTSDTVVTQTSYYPATSYSDQYGTYNAITTSGHAQSGAMISSAGGNTVSGAAPSHVTTPTTYVNHTYTSYSQPNGAHYGSWYYDTTNYARTDNYSGDFTVTLALNAAELSQIDALQTFTYSINPTNSPVLLGDSLHVDFLASNFAPLGSPVPAPATAGLFVLALGLLGVRRRVGQGVAS